MNNKIIYTGPDADYPKGHYVGAISVTKVRNAMKKIGYELVNASNNRCNNVLEGSSGFVKHPDGRLVYFSCDHSCVTPPCLYRTAENDRDYHGGPNNFCSDLPSLCDGVRSLFERCKW